MTALFALAYAILVSSLLLSVSLLGYRRKWKRSEARYERMRLYYRGKLFTQRMDKPTGYRNRRARRLRPRYPHKGILFPK
jgi:hypothetical protein